MTRIALPPFHRARPLIAAALAGSAALAAAAAPPAVPRPTPSPAQPAERSSDYELLEIGELMIHAKCEDGGRVYGTKKPAPGAPAAAAASAGTGRARPKGITAERDAAIRAACLAVDYSK
jgi:hypothetical protein